MAGTAVLIGLAGAAYVWWPDRPKQAPPARDTPRELFQQALAGLDRGETEPFHRAMRVLTKRPGYASHARLLEGVARLRSGEPQAALERFAALSAEGRLREPLLLYTAQSLHAANRLPEAELVLRRLVEESPDFAPAHRWLGIVYYDLGAYDYAIGHLKELAKLVPDDFRPHRLLGLMYRDFEQDQQAIDSYRATLERNPPAAVRNEVFEELAQALIALRRYDEAREVIEKAEPTAVLQTLAAQCLWSEGRPEAALQSLAKARRLDPTERRMLLLEAEIRAAQGERPKAIALLREAVRLHPYDAECHYQLGLVLREAGHTEEAEQELAAWERLKDLATRLTELNFKALKNPHDVEVRRQLVEVCEELGKDELAAMWRQTVQALQTGSRGR